LLNKIGNALVEIERKKKREAWLREPSSAAKNLPSGPSTGGQGLASIQQATKGGNDLGLADSDTTTAAFTDQLQVALRTYVIRNLNNQIPIPSVSKVERTGDKSFSAVATCEKCKKQFKLTKLGTCAWATCNLYKHFKKCIVSGPLLGFPAAFRP